MVVYEISDPIKKISNVEGFILKNSFHKPAMSLRIDFYATEREKRPNDFWLWHDIISFGNR